MVNRFRTITEEMMKKYENTSLIAFVKMDDNQDTWTILYSSPAVVNTEEGKEMKQKIFLDFSEALKKTYEADMPEVIGRVGIFPEDVHIISDALKFKAGTHITEPTRMNGNMISEGYITVSNSKHE